MRSIDFVKDYLSKKGYSLETIKVSPREKSALVKVTSPAGKTLIIDQFALVYPFASSALRHLFADKLRASAFMNISGVPIPDTFIVTKRQVEAGTVGQELLAKYGRVIAKPYNAQRSNGLTVDITNEAQLLPAVQKAMQFSTQVLIQEQFIGEEARFFVLDGKVRAILMRKKPSVTGNGYNTVAELIQQENEARKQITDTVVTYPQLTEAFIPTELLHSTAVPAEGERVELSRATMIKSGASVYNILATAHASYVEVIEGIAKNLGKGLFVVDLMSKDYTHLAVAGNYVFIEANLNAALAMCYSCRDGKQFDILEDALGQMIETAIETNAITA